MQYDVVVSGGGIVGLSAAIGMAKRGFSVALLDGGNFTIPEQEDFTRVFAINAASRQLFAALGMWPLLDMDHCAPYRQMEVRDAESQGVIAFDCRMLAMPELGHIIGETSLKKALLEKAKQETDLHFFPEETIQNQITGTQGLELTTNRQSLTTRLLMVAEGAHSSTRALLKVEMHQYSYHQQALIARVKCTKAHQNTARQVFLAEDGPLAFLPLPDPHQCSIVWSTRAGYAAHLQNLSAEAFNKKLSEAFDHQLGEVTLIGQRFSFPLFMRHVHRYSGAHWLLLGDAAHTIHPLAGLGLNLGLADLQVWFDGFDACANPDFPARMLAKYHRQRKTEVWKVIMMMQGLKSLFQNPFFPVIHLRGMGLNAVNRLRPLKRYLMKEAAGIQSRDW